ncbi:hypothetical protein APSETT445_002434 [Aspergillus pseudonomiae]
MHNQPSSDQEKPSSSALEHVAESSLEAVDEKRLHDEALPAYSVEMENRILRKMDLRIIPMLAVLYLLAFLDRGNIGNAKIEGLLDDLNITGPQYNWCCMHFLPAHLMKHEELTIGLYSDEPCDATAHVSACTDDANLLEAGLYPGVAYYITLWYPRHRAQYRQALFFSAASIAGAFSGLLAYGIAKMDGVGGYAGWRWIFILEGLLTVLVACIAPFAIHDSPETAKFLTEEERTFVIHMLRTHNTGGTSEATEFRMKYVVDALLDWQIYVSIIGIYPAFPGNITWLSANLAGDYKRASGMAIQIGLGNLAGAMASNFYRAQDAPNYILGHSLELGFCVAGMIAAVMLRLSYKTINRKRDQMDVSGQDEAEMEKMGDRSPMFRYML